MSSILKRILKGQARPAVMRPVPLVPQAARAEAVQTLELRIKGSVPMPTEERDRLMESAPFPGARSLLMAAGRVRQAEEGKVAQLERELVMERMRVRELRGVVDAVRAVVREMGEQYESIAEDVVCVWLEETLFPDLQAAVEGGGL